MRKNKKKSFSKNLGGNINAASKKNIFKSYFFKRHPTVTVRANESHNREGDCVEN
jgi:hypothetical protein